MNVRDERFPLFDSLRAIAALSVFVFHLPWFFEIAGDSPLRPYLAELNVGVAVFFLVSGFLLYRPFARARYMGEKAPATLPYAWRRALRIVPAYWVALVLTVVILDKSKGGGTTAPVFSLDGLSYFGFLQVYSSDTLLGGISAAWTLCIEVSFYAMLPLWAAFMRRVSSRSPGEFLRTELIGLGGLFLIGVVWTGVAAMNSEQNIAVFADVTQIKPWLWVLPAYLDHFALGMALAVLSIWVAGRSDEPRAVSVIDRAPWLPWLFAALAFFCLGNVIEWFSGNLTAQFVATHELQAAFAFALLLPAVFGAVDRGWVRKVLGNRVLLWIGIVSYGLYLWHVALISSLVDSGLLEDVGLVPFGVVALALTLAVAAASFYLVERPALRLGRRLSHRRRSEDADMRLRDLREHEQPQQGAP